MSNSAQATGSVTWPRDGGDLGRLIRGFDWAATHQGPASGWDPALRAAIDMLLSASAQIVLFWGEDYRVFYNDAYAPTIGDKHPHALGQPAREWWSELWDDLGPLLDGVRATGTTFSARDRPFQINRRGALEEVFFDVSYSAIRATDGEVGGVLCIVNETTDLIRLKQTLEARVAEQTRERDRIWRNSRDLIAILSPEGTFRSVNPAWTARLGYDEAEIVGRPVFDVVFADDHAGARGALARAATREGLANFEVRLRARDGAVRWFSWNTQAEDGVIYGYGRDITDEKASAEALALAEEQLRQAQKMEAVGQLTGGIAHDFNNLLQGITGSLDLMRRRLGEGRLGDLDRFITSAMSSAERASALTHRLLAFSRRQPLDPRPVMVNPLVAGMEDLLRRTLGEAVALELVLAGGLWPTFCDANQLENAILNLAINARDAMPDGGRLTIETANTYLDNAYVARDRELKPGQYVCVSVSDTGVGMDSEVISRAFDPFFTTKPIGQGTGLGLSMIYGFARQSEGSIKLYSEIGHGTTAKLYLPRHLGAQPDKLTAEEIDPGEAQVTVLVVEDDAVVRSLIVEVLGELGYRALQAADGFEGLQVLRGDRRIDLLVTDIGLPGLNGRQMAEGARVHRPGLKVLFMTGYAENAALASGFLEPGMEMVTKPFAMEVFARRVTEMLHKP